MNRKQYYDQLKNLKSDADYALCNDCDFSVVFDNGISYYDLKAIKHHVFKNEHIVIPFDSDGESIDEVGILDEIDIEVSGDN